jgi:hypothetical protein
MTQTAETEQTADHRGSLTHARLQTSLRHAEAGLFKLTRIEVVGSKTRSTHDNANPVPSRSLILVEDPDGDVTAPPGADPEWVVRGEAMIEGSKKKVAAFRKAAAAATPAPPASTPAPPPPPPSGQGEG